MSNINWKDFEGKYWSPRTGRAYIVTLTNWRQESKSYDDGKTSKEVLAFDIVQSDDDTSAVGKTFNTASIGFAEQVKPIIEDAEERGSPNIEISIEWDDKNKTYRVFDIRKVRGRAEKAMQGGKE